MLGPLPLDSLVRRTEVILTRSMTVAALCCREVGLAALHQAIPRKGMIRALSVGFIIC